MVYDLDLVLLMTVNPGFGGQSFIESQTEKVGRVREMIGDRPIRLEIDGSAKSGDDGKGRADADTIVASSAVFKGGCFEAYRRQYRRDPAAAPLKASLQRRIERRTAHSAGIERARILFPECAERNL